MGDGTPARLDSRAMTQADLTRQRLIRAALELFTTTGYHFTTTPLIARKAGVAEGTIYRHFDSKQQLLNELYRAAGRWAVRVVKEADGLKVGPREKLAELGRGLVAGAAREPAVAQLFFVQLHGDLHDDASRKVAPDFRPGRSVNSSISGGAKTRIGTPTTPMPRLTYSWLSPRWKCPITYFVINRPGDHPIPGT